MLTAISQRASGSSLSFVAGLNSRSRGWRSCVFRIGIFSLLGVFIAGAVASQPGEPAVASGQDGEVVHVELASPIHPMAAGWLEQVLAEAAEIEAAAVVVELNTPGGSLPATRRICQAFLGSEVPVVVYVAPGGAQAASAGFFLLMAGHVAVMAPGTNTGAAHPVAGGGEDIEGDLGEKVEQDTLALIRALAEERGRNLEAAQTAISESASFTASEAKESGLIDYVAPDLSSLLTLIDGTEVKVAKGAKSGETRRLATAGATIRYEQMSAEQRFLAALAHPQIAGLLMAFGLLGLYVEISNPGLIFPGVVGAICLLLGFFAMSVLPVNFAGVALLALALVLFVAETQVPTFGALTLGGAVALGLGLTMLVDEMDPALRPSPWWAVTIAILIAAVAGMASMSTLASRRRTPVTGQEGMLGAHGVVRRALAPAGTVTVHGEIWQAAAAEPLAVGTEVVVTELEGLKLTVREALPEESARQVTEP